MKPLYLKRNPDGTFQEVSMSQFKRIVNRVGYLKSEVSLEDILLNLSIKRS